MTLSPAVSLGDRYRLQERVAVGGMGEVWRATDAVLGRTVAVKVLREDYARDPRFRARFRDGARHAASLSHPNVAQVYDFGDGAGGEPPYLVMELVAGEPLSRLLAREGPLSAERTWSVVGQAAAALAAAHGAGVVHRDVKPGNLLVCPDGQVKVSDFGVARAVHGAAATTGGLLVGTAQYLAPERATGAPGSPASDVYGLGVVAYECLAGRRPFDGDLVGVLDAHRERPVPALPDEVPPTLASLVDAMLAKEPTARPEARSVAARAARATGTAATGTTAGPVTPYPDEPLDPGATGHDPPTRVFDEPPTLTTPAAAAAPAPRARAAPRGRRAPALTLGAAAVAVVVAAVAAVAVLGGGGHRGGAAPSHAQPSVVVRPLPVYGVRLFHPGGSADDYPGKAHLAADGQDSTGWVTQHYASAQFGNLRPGVGLAFDLGGSVTVDSAQVLLAVPGVDVAVYAADSLGSLRHGHPVATRHDVSQRLRLRFAPGVTARYWLVWFSRLAPSGGGYRAGIDEVRFVGH